MEIPRPVSDGQKLREDRTSSSEEDQTFQSLLISREPFLNLKMSSSQEVKKLSLLETEDNNWIEDYFFSNTKLKDFSKEESASQLKINKEDTEPWITQESCTKKKIKSSNSKKKFKISKKDSEDLQRDKTNLRKRSSD